MNLPQLLQKPVAIAGSAAVENSQRNDDDQIMTDLGKKTMMEGKKEVHMTTKKERPLTDAAVATVTPSAMAVAGPSSSAVVVPFVRLECSLSLKLLTHLEEQSEKGKVAVKLLDANTAIHKCHIRKENGGGKRESLPFQKAREELTALEYIKTTGTACRTKYLSLTTTGLHALGEYRQKWKDPPSPIGSSIGEVKGTFSDEPAKRQSLIVLAERITPVTSLESKIGSTWQLLWVSTRLRRL